MNRRSFLASILAAGAAPAFVRGGMGILMPTQALWTPVVIGCAFSWPDIEGVPERSIVLPRLISDGMQAYKRRGYDKIRLVEVLEHDRILLPNQYATADRVRLAVEVQ